MHRRSFITLAAAGAVAGKTAFAAPVDARRRRQPQPSVFVVHGIPGVPVDVYVDAALALPNFQPGTVEGPIPLPAGERAVEIFGAGADPTTAQPVIAAQAPLRRGQTASLVAHLAAAGTPTLTPFAEQPIPRSRRGGRGRLAVRHAAALGPVDIYLASDDDDLELVFSGVGNGEGGGRVLQAGSYDLAVAAAGDPPSAAALQGTVDVTAGETLAVYAIGDPGAGTLAILTQTIRLGRPR
jgi:hypothetical protein